MLLRWEGGIVVGMAEMGQKGGMDLKRSRETWR